MVTIFILNPNSFYFNDEIEVIKDSYVKRRYKGLVKEY